MKAMNPEFQPLLDEGEALKERLISALNKDNKSSYKFELRTWFNSVINQTQGISYYRTDLQNNIIEHAEFYLESLTPTQVANQIDRLIEMIGSIPPIRASSVNTPSLEITPALLVNLELQELIALCQAALRPSRKPWEHFLKRLGELKKTQALTPDEGMPIVVSQLIDDLLRNIDADLDDTERQILNITEEYQRLKSVVEGRALYFAKIISGTTFRILSILIMIGAIGLILGHPFHGGLIDVIIGVAIIVFVLIEIFGILQHLAHLRSNLQSWILPRLRRFLGAEKSPKSHVPTILGLP